MVVVAKAGMTCDTSSILQSDGEEDSVLLVHPTEGKERTSDVGKPRSEQKKHLKLGDRVAVTWMGRMYRGTVTRQRQIQNCPQKQLVFVSYDEGDQCWSDLQLEEDLEILNTNGLTLQQAKENIQKGKLQEDNLVSGRKKRRGLQGMWARDEDELPGKYTKREVESRRYYARGSEATSLYASDIPDNHSDSVEGDWDDSSDYME
eukprot:CAMPEP_0178750054 /NCGR_PEP_ID=MMETSP0744-20121128/9740_1 /TAXON_ID=913974 /ORGANISM="Nitzschia punctata, Strain CCMP561" /LENGTH=203 /DNA_ID=CAMNT_0020403511 /DNA_START=37 /DNA_END=648 /DNA_ORIENTATION=-